ncbi:MAG: hypothetical protein EBU59_12695, partial [Planctomycetia bacterium]|nr:hypothetical protein [Planctomycetia bacterium]
MQPKLGSPQRLYLLFVLAAILKVLTNQATAGDWPQVLGPVRTGIAAADERLADRWPDAGPPAWPPHR